MKFCRTDVQSILSHIKRQEKQIKLMRRWLMGIPTSKSEWEKLNFFFKNKFLSESLLREDDIFYESVRTRVEGAFGKHHIERENHVLQDDIHLMHTPNIKRLISSCLDKLTTKGLYLLAMIVTGGSVKSERTRCNLKKIIKGSLSSFLGSKSHNHHKQKTCKQIFQLLTNPQNFRDRCEPLSGLRSQSSHAAVAKVLQELHNLPSQSLIAMRRKLKGVKAPIPQLQPRKLGWRRDHLIKLVKKISREMLSQLDRGNELQEPLAKAMAVADLSLKLITGCHNIFSEEFYQFSPEVKSLQSDIMNAIWSVKKVGTVPQLRSLQLLIEPKAIISNRSLRTAFVNFLIEFLVECSEMDSIPKSLLQILDVINRGSNDGMHNALFQKKYIEEEVDCILSVSAQTKQIVLDLLPDHEFDQDFNDAYMEQLEDSDDSSSDEDDDDSQLPEDRQFVNGTFISMDSSCGAESIGDFTPFESHPSTSMTQENVSLCPITTSERLNRDSEKLQTKKCYSVNMEFEVHTIPPNVTTNQYLGQSTEHFSTFMAGKTNNSSVISLDRESDENIIMRHDFYESDTERDPRDTDSLFCEETESIPTKYSLCKNQYLATQDACDKTSMLAYNLIGRMVEEFAIIEGLNLNLSQSLYLSGDNQVEEVEETKEQSSCGKHAKCSAIVRVIEELIPSFPDSGMERLKMLMGL
ncbi:uncharacterized protein LOC133298510 [Gastrolobium bilobum]|uniref:uncharacterized protein LOC133298510 n=1 Tax=Gastrolobium bilobum TaxID=150636 RepID=UPI002AAFEEBE|nr:uncharacterized protein LOC133298510 [Gastrolobium bilobum]XP_061353789.1 uncharacterized protein LOC133298510 [Gastrolobium bilobum]XP_061353790.1 uncharacterized protein LOC133298510 [Gastrolobium bilobum]XP_061353791.1 uncharacterized protein LOC133298510 [Gastrolobium bilobum]XP_061353792.1 uncharacterized protein LOC133298510 [Gastrolobium bilobum]